MSNQVLVSVVMPVYNGARYIKRAIDSALGQETPVEVLVIDDQSTDGLSEALDAYRGDSRVKWLQNTERLGVAGSRNRGVREASGEYIAFLDADDWWAEGKLMRQLEKMRETQAVMSTTGRELMKPSGEPAGRQIGVRERITYKELLKHNSISTSSVVALREVMLCYPMEHDDSHEDYITWLKVAKEYGWILGIDEPMLKYRLSEGSKSRNKWKSAAMTFQVYRYLGLNMFQSVLCFISYAFHGVMKYYGASGRR